MVKLDFTRARILIVDDNTSVRTILQALLSFSGAPEAEEAADAEAALKQMARHRYDAVILDCNLGGRSGLDVAREVRQTPGPNQNVPILMVTARQDLMTVKEAKSAGIDEYLIKPVTATALATRLTSALIKRQKAAEAAAKAEASKN